MNNRNSVKCLSIILLISISFAGCKKEEGVGGTSSIRGKVIVHDFDGGFQNPVPDLIYPAADEKVYIIYGSDDETYDDDFDTSFDGTFEFKHLQKGKYKVFAYKKDTTGAYNGSIGTIFRPDIPVIYEVEITSNGSTVEVPQIIILDNNN